MNQREVNEESMETSNVVPEGVRELLEQRSTYRMWLERLDDVGGEYRPAVAERVRHDYEERLSSVARELEGHRQELVSTTERRRGRLDELSSAFEARSAELEEAELRFQVGEFDDETWEERRTELTEGLEEIEAELEGARSAVDELEQVLDELEDGPAPAAKPRATEPAVAASPPSSRPPLKAVDGGLADGPAGTDEVEEAQKAEEIPVVEAEDADEAVSEEPAETATASAQEDAGEPDYGETDDEPDDDAAMEESVPVAAEAETDEYRDELEFLESLSLDDPDSFDAVSRMLEDEEDR